MSTLQLEQMVDTLRALPESRQREVWGFIRALTDQPESATEVQGDLPAGLEWEAGLLVYNGKVLVDDPVALVREERMQTLIEQAVVPGAD